MHCVLFSESEIVLSVYLINMPRPKKCHDGNRSRICLLCMGKCKEMREISEEQLSLIDKYIVSGLDKHDTRLPNALCASCRLFLNELKADPNIDTSNLDLFDYSKLNTPRPLTRSSPECFCYICELSASPLVVKSFNNTFSKKKSVGRPAAIETRPSTPIKICPICLSIIAKGTPHNCTVSQRHENVHGFIQSGPSNSGEKIAARVLKDVSMNGETTTLSLSQRRGRPVRVELFPEKENTPYSYSVEDMATFKKDLNLSTNTTLKLAHGLRAASKNKDAVDKGLKSFLIGRNRQLDDYYSVEYVDFDEGDKPVVFCSAVGALVELILLERRMFEDGIECKVGVDGGGGFLKICLNIFSHEDFKDTPASSKRRKYSDGICLKDSKNTSVNKLLILAIVPGLPEKYEHISRLFDILKLDQLEEEYYKIRYAADLKMINLLLGLMAHSSAHPCSWCTIDK